MIQVSNCAGPALFLFCSVVIFEMLQIINVFLIKKNICVNNNDEKIHS